jgi:hypothetical protein
VQLAAQLDRDGVVAALETVADLLGAAALAGGDGRHGAAHQPVGASRSPWCRGRVVAAQDGLPAPMSVGCSVVGAWAAIEASRPRPCVLWCRSPRWCGCGRE